MHVEVRVPEVGESITEGVLVTWNKEDGSLVQAGEELFELETDKVTMAVPSEVAGRLQIQVQAGETVKVGQVVATIDIDVAVIPATVPTQDQPPLPREEPPSVTKEIGDGPPISPRAGMEQAQSKLQQTDVNALAPAVRRLVEENQLDIGQISASGKGGRITKEDVLTHLQQKSAAAATVVQQGPKGLPAPTPPSSVDVASEGPKETRQKMSSLRHRIAERLLLAQQNAAILTTFNEVDMSAVMAFRAKHKDKFEKKFDVRLGFMSFFVKAAVDAMKTVPQLNSRIDGDEIVRQHYYDIGIAVGTEQGLLVPVIRAADQMSFADIEKQIMDYGRRAREKKIKLEELSGGCFTISNGGIYGSLLSTPILNPPQSGILGMHRIDKRAVVIQDEIVIRPMMYLALSYDHRLVDGAQAVTFLKRIVECIQDPERMLLEV